MTQLEALTRRLPSVSHRLLARLQREAAPRRRRQPVGQDGWTVRIRRGTVEWTPPPELDTGQARINYHHPHRLLAPDDEEA